MLRIPNDKDIRPLQFPFRNPGGGAVVCVQEEQGNDTQVPQLHGTLQEKRTFVDVCIGYRHEQGAEGGAR